MTCSIHGECPYCKAERVLGDPRESVQIASSNVFQLPMKCPLCEGSGSVNAMGEDGWVRAHACSMCKGTGKRPTDVELAERRATNPTKPDEADSHT